MPSVVNQKDGILAYFDQQQKINDLNQIEKFAANYSTEKPIYNNGDITFYANKRLMQRKQEKYKNINPFS